MKTLLEKLALVTGSSRGLGKDMALRLAEKGADVIITYQSNASAAQETVQKVESLGQKAIALQLDTGKIDTFNGFFETLKSEMETAFGKTQLDILVNNAGIIPQSLVAQMDEATFDLVTNVQYKGVFFLTQKALELIPEGGRIINISTGLTRFSIPGHAAYAAAKSAVETFTKYLAKELGGNKITVNVVAPGAMNTDVNREAFAQNQQLSGFISQMTALGRIGESEDVGGVVSFLATDDAAWITGQRIEVSGGMFL
ncbi:SDR family oxidoreductase [Flagellimonas allohymeniacidonis]|uniref:SDR family oxidoreductase n=1 Tax=Flagellimonas allohymeniacidonis TaxID=2517819 RepID=A0A4Q8QLK0_9FLAO|nr:SDR family oxidoreductase [Allomuricauda hymeniacidonis]TAI49429.1 SDR family oxidoreductase [Allomuricauda hymeniacidonis]